MPREWGSDGDTSPEGGAPLDGSGRRQTPGAVRGHQAAGLPGLVRFGGAWALFVEAAAPSAVLSDHGDLLRAVFDTVPMAVAVVAVPGFEVLLANRRFRGLLVGPPASAVGRRLADLVPSHLGAELLGLLQRAATGDGVSVTDHPFYHPSQDTTYYSLSVSPIRDQTGGVACLVFTAEDTTARVSARLEAESLAERLRATNEQLTLANLRLQTIIGQLPQGVIAVDYEQRIVLVNRAAEQLLGTALPPGVKLYSLGVARYKPDGTAYAVDELPLPRSLRGETCYGVEIEVKQPGGGVAHTLCSSAPLYDAAGRVVAAVSIFQDFTELWELDRLKDEFLSIASHELKNPLTVLKGYVQMLLLGLGRTEVSDAREQQILSAIDREVNRLSRLIGVMLDVSRMQLGGVRLDLQPMDLAALAGKLTDHFQGVFPRHRFSLESEQEKVEGRWDPTRTEQVLANLLDNAVKYSPKGGRVTVSIRIADGQAEVAVRDEGVGIPLGEQGRVFEKFYRARSRTSKHVAGMGLGLYVCQEIVRAHGGRMWLESEPGCGSTFSFSLPLGS